MTIEKPLRWLKYSVLITALLATLSCRKKMNHEFAVQARPEILGDLQVNVLYFDDHAFPLLTYYDRGHTTSYQGHASGYVLYINYRDTLFFRMYCDRNPEYFPYSDKKRIVVEQQGDHFYANVVFLARQEGHPARYDASTQLLSWAEAQERYAANDFHPPAWGTQISLEEKFKGRFPSPRPQNAPPRR